MARVAAAQRGYVEVWGMFAFSTTDANGTVQPLLRQIDLVELTPAGVPNVDEQLYVSTANVGGIITVSGGIITIARTGTKTSGLQFWAKFRGFSS
jgi:hypothetical protein